MPAPLPSDDEELSIDERVAMLGQAINYSACTVDEAAAAISQLPREAIGEILLMLEAGMEARDMLKRAGVKYD